MGKTAGSNISYLQKLFYFTHVAGFAAGLVFPFLVYPLLGEAALSAAFFISCMIMGYTVGAAMYVFVRVTLKKSLRAQMELLAPLTGVQNFDQETVEIMHRTVETSVHQVQSLIQDLVTTLEEFVPLYQSLASGSRYLSERAQEGLEAALVSRKDVEAMESKQQDVMTQVANLTNRAQEEASLSRELSASLEEMAQAMDISAAKFLETTSSVDELASSVIEVSAQADQVARSVEGTAQDLDATGAALDRIRQAASHSASASTTVKTDAEAGLRVVQKAMEEMELIRTESRQASSAMGNLAQQTGEVAKIIEVIRELVSDTELLAFNAAIIAAKAGEEGRGFAVVAEEIRDLADRTTNSAQDIQRIINAIGAETHQVTAAVDATGERIATGYSLSQSAGEALGKIVTSSTQAAQASLEIAETTENQGKKAKVLIEEAGQSLRAIQAIARAIQEQQITLKRTQEGVNEMKAASDQVTRGMEEQVQANREFNRGLNDRETQIQAINGATMFQQETAQKVFEHFSVSESRLRKNVEKSKVIIGDLDVMEKLATRLHDLAGRFQK